ncbi:Pancreatic triacylglycerol lipase [Frankliniella fusca]|uniref:Pancreatic triacylglycerol lipase n=1 Tax=Frankliniella fusca TaxID=407009 RepID=A0AAE1HQF9_9NEOP|nr:Pancreatic triacylglycerol lipase [Frankliniella fusca]
MKTAVSLLLLAAALQSVHGESLVESTPVVGDAVDTESLGETLVNATTNITTAVTDGFKEAKLVLFTTNKNATFDLDTATSLLDDADFNSELPTVLYMHGYEETIDSESVGVVSKAFLRKASHNFIFVDWSEYAKSPYLSAFAALPGVSAVVGDAVDRLVQAGLSRDGLWLIGHSMGGQMAGILSKSLDFLPKRITALDPARPGYQLSGVPNLTRDDALLVDVIHTDAGVFGFDEPCGHLDFWPNSGRPLQPGCQLLSAYVFCSHHRSWWFFSESVNNETAFPAVKCSSWNDFEEGECPVNATNIAYLGYKLPIGAQVGDYYLRTNDASPFARGLQGVTVDLQKSHGISELFGGIASKTQDFFGRLFPIF